MHLLILIKFAQQFNLNLPFAIYHLSLTKRGNTVNINVNATIELKKPHPCGSREFTVLRAGMDFKIKCIGCGHELMVPRVKLEKSVKKIIEH
jgi:hypothetical protein